MIIDRILLDLDGVVADFFTASTAHFGGMPAEWPPGQWHIPTVLGVTDKEFWAKLDSIEDFWINIPAYLYLTSFYEGLKQIAPVTVATSPSMDPKCLSGKVEWMYKHFGPRFHDYMIGSRKELMASPNRVLIDDRDENVARFRKAGGLAVLFPQPWNANHKYAREPLQYTFDVLTLMRIGGTPHGN